MTRPLRVAFLWHMHQPLYQESVGGKFLLPWVRLHAIKGYTDMPAVLANHPTAKAAFNLTPSLLVQIEEYFKEDIREKDEFLRVTLKPAAMLESREKEFILSNFFMNNWERVIKPHPRYSELLNLRGGVYKAQEISHITKRFSDQDYLDLQVLFNLTWFGFTLRKKEHRLRALLAKQRFYTEDDKIEVISHQLAAMRELLALYRKLQDQGQTELTTTPFYHPILPLLYNGGGGEGYNWKEDAEIQLKKGLDLFERHFSSRPSGLWPSEGSVSESVAQLASEVGIHWMGTDEEILLQSLGDGTKRESAIYAPYLFRKEGREIVIFFRDKKLSDLIGFSYSKSDPELAVTDFLSRLRHIHSITLDQVDDPMVSVILDGENAWEHYENDGEQFLNLLYERLAREPWLKLSLFSETLKHTHPKRSLDRLHSGSWINKNFQIWYGHPEDRLAWEYLQKTRDFLLREHLTPEKKTMAWEELYVAEGSDWFWWYGDEFSSSTQEIFDYLFRNHLMNVFRIADRRIPGFLLKPIKQSSTHSQALEPPSALISPVIDGCVTGFYEWAGAGHFAAIEPQGAMQQSEKWVRDIYFGANRDTLYLRVDLDLEQLKNKTSNVSCQIYLGCIDEYLLEVDLASGDVVLYELLLNDRREVASSKRWAVFDKVLEIALPFNSINIPVRNTVEVKVSVLKNKIPLEEAPRLGLIKITRPDEALEKSLWSL